MVKKISTWSFIFILASVSIFTSCSDDDDKTPESALPITLNFSDPNLDLTESTPKQPYVLNKVSSWFVGLDDKNELTIVPNPSIANTKPVEITNFKSEKDENGNEVIWNWTGMVHLLSGNALLTDLTDMKGISKITVVGLDNNSFLQAMAYNGETLVFKTEQIRGSSDAYVTLTLPINKKEVTQLYVIGLESGVKSIVIE